MNTAIFILAGAALAAGIATEAVAGEQNGRAFAEQAMQSYLAMWSHDRDVNARSVARFYAPRIDYYGKSMSRAQVLADKLAFVRQWPVRDYRQAPGTFAGTCNRDMSRCSISAVLTWHRVGRTDQVSEGRARIHLEFVPVEGTRKIARESARLL